MGSVIQAEQYYSYHFVIYHTILNIFPSIIAVRLSVANFIEIFQAKQFILTTS